MNNTKDMNRKYSSRLYDNAQLLSIVFTTVSGIALSLSYRQLPTSIDSIKDIPWITIILILAIFLGVLAIKLTGASSSARKHEELISSLSQLQGDGEALKRSLMLSHGVRYIGSGEGVFDHIRARVRSAKEVINTLVGVNLTTEYEKNAEKIYQEYFAGDKEREWRDLVSYSEIFGPRFHMKLDHSAVGDRHIVNVLRHSVPLVNAMIIRDETDHGCVFFGWGGAENPSRAQIFFSEDPRLVKLFDDYVRNLWKTKTVRDQIRVNYSKQGRERLTGLDIVDKAGRWLTLGYQPGKRGRAVAIESYGIIDISFKEGVSVKGQVYNADKSEKNKVLGEKILDAMTRINFDYGFTEGDNPRTGFCVYNFYDGSEGSMLLHGFFVNNVQRIRKNVVGIKVDSVSSEKGRAAALNSLLPRYEVILLRLAEERERLAPKGATARKPFKKAARTLPRKGRL